MVYSSIWADMLTRRERAAVRTFGRLRERERVMKNRISNVIWGVLLIVVGIGYGGNSLGLWDFSIFFKGWWTFFIIIPCLANLIRYGVNGGNVVGLLIGAALLCNARGFLNFSIIWKLFMPVVLILIGVSILLSNTQRRIKDQQGNRISYEKGGPAASDVSAVFSGRKASCSNEVFRGATVNAVFGDVDLDLRMAVIEEDVRIDATAVFGGIKIKVPSNVVVKVMSVPVLGGVSNKAMAPTEIPCHTLYLNATCVFGGVDIR